MPAGPHRADEDLGVEEVVGEADPVAEQGPVRERARRIDGDDADCLAVLADSTDERRDQARLADAWRARDPDGIRAPRIRVDVANELVRERVRVLDERDRARESALLARADTFSERLPREVAAGSHSHRLDGALARTAVLLDRRLGLDRRLRRLGDLHRRLRGAAR